ncbi:MAG: DUF2442 domain-containing protein [Caldilinea sp.]
MISYAPGADISAVEVTNISKHGFWLFFDDKEYFLPFVDFPWFRNAPVSAILNVERLHETHFHWPALDVDLELDSILHPGRYPLVAQAISE